MAVKPTTQRLRAIAPIGLRVLWPRAVRGPSSQSPSSPSLVL